MANQWPYHSFLELGALPSAVPCARLHAKQVLWEWGLYARANNTELVVSELVTNAINASRALEQDTPVRLWVLADKAQIVIVVWDASQHPPAPGEGSDEAENGRGLLLVDAISEQWSWYFDRQGTGGKYVWAQLQK